METDRVQAVLGTLGVAGLELAIMVGVAVLLYRSVARGVRRATEGRTARFADSGRTFRLRLRRALILSCVALTAVILVYNGWLVARGVNGWTLTLTALGTVGRDVWMRIAIAIAKVVAASLLVWAVIALGRRILAAGERRVTGWSQLESHTPTVRSTFAGVERVIVTTGWLVVGLFALWLLEAPGAVLGSAVTIGRTYLVIAVGLLLVRSTSLTVDALDGFGQRRIEGGPWQRHYDHLRRLVPTFRACVEYVLWIGVAALTISQLGYTEAVSLWAPRLIEAIGLFFLGRVLIELGHMEILRRMLPEQGLDEMTRRRRSTIAPIVRSTFTYAVYFATIVLILASLGFNPMPFLAGAGILGLVVGFGAQALIHDVVSGFFILFENTYLVGDTIEAANAKGIVEAIEFRTTKMRDADGRVHVVRNGDVKQVVNYSKEYSLAIVTVDAPYDADLSEVFATLREAGQRARRDNPDVLGDTQIEGISAFGPLVMTVRTSTRVRPGRHDAAAAALRLAMKEAFDRRSSGAPRKTLVPEGFVAAAIRH
jgi:moderate conductance mechanosensitive channel